VPNKCLQRTYPPSAGLPLKLGVGPEKNMTTSRLTNMRSALRAAAAGALEQGWLYLESSQSPSLDAPCLMVDADPDDDTEAIAREKGFSQEGLDTATIEDTAKWAGQFQNPPADELFLESFVYY
jgi:hypothetical protein